MLSHGWSDVSLALLIFLALVFDYEKSVLFVLCWMLLVSSACFALVLAVKL